MNAGELVVSLLLKAGDFKAQVQDAQRSLDDVHAAAREAGKAMSEAAAQGATGFDGLGTSADGFLAEARKSESAVDNVRAAAHEAGKAMSEAAAAASAGFGGLGASAGEAAGVLGDIDLSGWKQQFKAAADQFAALYGEIADLSKRGFMSKLGVEADKDSVVQSTQQLYAAVDARKKNLLLELGVEIDKDGVAQSAQRLYGDIANRLASLSKGDAMDLGQRLGFSRQSIEFLRQGEDGIKKILIAADGSAKELALLGRAAEKTGKEIAQAGDKGAFNLERLKGVAAQALAVIGGVAALKGAVSRYYEAAQSIEKTSDALGMSIEDWQAWQRTAASAGVDAEELSTRFMDLGDWMQDLILHDSGPLKDATKDLGVSFTDAKGKAVSFEEGLLRLSDATSKIDRQKATSILTQIGFDEKTIPFILKGRKGIEDLLKVQKAQAIYSKQDIENAKKQREAQQRLNDAWEAISALFASTVSPAITFLTDLLGDLLGWVKENKQSVILFFTGLAGVVTTLMLPALTAMATAAWAAIAPFTPLIAAIGAIALVIDDLITYINGGESALSGLWSVFGTGDEIGARFKAIWEGIQSILGGVWDALSGVAKLFNSVLTLDGKGVIEALKTIWGGISKINDVLVEMLNWVAQKLYNLLPDWIKDWLGGDESSRPEEMKTEAKPGGVADSMRVADARPSILPPQVRAGDARPGSLSNVNNSRQMTSTTNVGEVKVYTQATDAQGMAEGAIPAIRNQTAQADSAFGY